ncbi:hypothetical protein HWV62_33195 [Athelia sp. TMB]|nr:hypothetical protein HWV62_33195 [Athelia sp. TMB]
MHAHQAALTFELRRSLSKFLDALDSNHRSVTARHYVWYKIPFILPTCEGLTLALTMYFEAKKISKHQVAVFMEVRKWDYRTFGSVVSLLEGLPITRLVFTISNRSGATMWAHDLEKKQCFIAAKQRKGGLHPATPAASSKNSTPGSTYPALESPATAPPHCTK